jgi:branched-chain amino acid transport system substrate-binding protein
MAYTQLQLQRWNGTTWEQFGNVLSADQKGILPSEDAMRVI